MNSSEENSNHSVANSPQFRRFAIAAEIFINCFSDRTMDSKSWSRLVLMKLSELYSIAQGLPKIEFEEALVDKSFDVSHEEWEAIFRYVSEKLGNQSSYWTVLDPYREPGPSAETDIGSLEDDLAGVYIGIKPGLSAWNLDPQMYASQVHECWNETLSFRHWGKHAVNAMRPLHEIVYPLSGGIHGVSDA